MSTQRFELFLDESGRFMETSVEPEERKLGKQSFPSQFAGVLAPAGDLNQSSATRILEEAFAAGGKTFSGTAHGKDDFGKHGTLDPVVTHLVRSLAGKNWFPVRMVNAERVSYGDRAANITNVLGELCLRIFVELRRMGFRDVELTVVPARVRMVEREGDDGFIETLRQNNYWRRLQEALGQSAVRAGRASQSRAWRITAVRIRSAREDPELMVCDLLSNASYGDFSKLGPDAKEKLRAAFGRFDFSLQIRADLETVNDLLASRSPGLALQHLANRLSSKDLDPTLRSQLEHRTRDAIQQLADMGAPARNPQLEIISTSLEETIRHNRDLEHGQRLTRWLRSTLLPKLAEQLAERDEQAEIAWFAYTIHDRALETCNHSGDLCGAKAAIAAMDEHDSVLTERWEHVDRFAQGQIHKAVHLTDCRSFNAAADIAAKIETFYGDIGQLFHAALEERFPERVKSKRRGEALGTQLQARMYAAVACDDDEAFDEARQLNDQALEEFDQKFDRIRQMQYRCQLESLAGDFEAAQSWLAKSLDLDGSSTLMQIAQAIATESNEFGRGFLLLHFARLGARIARSGSGDLPARFERAFAESGLAQDIWLQTSRGLHPEHALLRYRAESELRQGNEDLARGHLNKLRRICQDAKPGIVLSAQLLACHAHILAHVMCQNPRRARDLLDQKSKAEPGFLQQVEKMRTVFEGFAGWTKELEVLARIGSAMKEPGSDTARLAGELDQAAARIVL